MNCFGCSKEFIAKRKDQKFCDSKCYNVSEYKREYNKKNCFNHYHNKGGKQRRKWKHSRRQHWIEKYKENKGCERCGYNKAACALDFDHIDAYQKQFNISRAVRDLSFTIQEIIKEIRKCRLLCSNCHRVETNTQNLYYKKRLFN